MRRLKRLFFVAFFFFFLGGEVEAGVEDGIGNQQLGNLWSIYLSINKYGISGFSLVSRERELEKENMEENEKNCVRYDNIRGHAVRNASSKFQNPFKTRTKE